ncbi:glycosyltransferase family 4 protein [Paludibacter jiangxiensis]|uniref:Glycosyltransferase n=1 Tax=Paludibacter jiangxiensis TaxID=681398 RepID=A0A171A3H5_9BACT|nr:glycosyltransferase family 4 protein [Paludibacter jiangxiensis]GAT63253.1 glycosyltransferase [Paludibacter jiangxiensis]
MKIIISHPTGNSNVREAVDGLTKANILFKFYTCIAVFPETVLFKLGSISYLKELRRRKFNPNLRSMTNTYPWREIGRLFALKVGWQKLIEHESGVFSVDAIYHSLDNYIATNIQRTCKTNTISGIYAYEDGAEYSFSIAKQIGLDCFYDLPTGYWRASRALLHEEIERKPDWADTFTGFKDSEIKLKRKDKELSLADVVFVASKFTADTLKTYPGKLPPVKIIPYGFPPVFEHREYEGFEKMRKIKLLFVGKLTQQKGLADLFDAIKGLEQYVELTLVGPKPIQNIKLNHELTNHHYLKTLPHDEILLLMRKHDILVFPSLFDGFGMVITEAMSQGTPVIASDRSAGPDLIKHGENGWIISAGIPSTLRVMIEQIIETPEILEKVGRAAMESARKRPWRVYGKELANAIMEYDR